MAQQDNGPATGTASLLFGAGPTTSVEVHIPVGTDPLSPSAAPYVDPQASSYVSNAVGASSVVASSTNKAVQFGSLGTGIQFTIPA